MTSAVAIQQMRCQGTVFHLYGFLSNKFVKLWVCTCYVKYHKRIMTVPEGWTHTFTCYTSHEHTNYGPTTSPFFHCEAEFAKRWMAHPLKENELVVTATLLLTAIGRHRSFLSQTHDSLVLYRRDTHVSSAGKWITRMSISLVSPECTAGSLYLM